MHIVENSIGLQCLNDRTEATGHDVAAADIAEYRHPSGAGSLDAGWTVLDDEAALGRHAHLPGGMKEEIGRRLAVFDHAGGKDVAAKIGEQPRQFEAELDALGLAGGGDAERYAETRERFRDAPGRL